MAPVNYPILQGFSDDPPREEDDTENKFLLLMALRRDVPSGTYCRNRGEDVTAEGKMAWLRCELNDTEGTYIRFDHWMFMKDPTTGRHRYFYETKWVNFYRFDALYPCFKMPYKGTKGDDVFYNKPAGIYDSISVPDDEDFTYCYECESVFDHDDNCSDWDDVDICAGYPNNMSESRMRRAWKREFASE